MNGIFLGFGSNLGDRKSFLENALVLLEKDNIRVLKRSRIFETDPVDFVDQPKFLNMVVEVETNLKPEDLLKICLDIEQKLGRERNVRFGPRTIDIDVLLYQDKIIQTDFLTVPHSCVHKRRFVLELLAEIAPEFIHPIFQKTVRQLFSEID